MAHQGLREFSGEELAGLALGQGGFHILPSASAVTAASKGITHWIAIKAIGAAQVKAQSYGPGDDLSLTGAYGGGVITMVDGDIIYGSWDEINVDAQVVLAYIGK